MMHIVEHIEYLVNCLENRLLFPVYEADEFLVLIMTRDTLVQNGTDLCVRLLACAFIFSSKSVETLALQMFKKMLENYDNRAILMMDKIRDIKCIRKLILIRLHALCKDHCQSY